MGCIEREIMIKNLRTTPCLMSIVNEDEMDGRRQRNSLLRLNRLAPEEEEDKDMSINANSQSLVTLAKSSVR